MSGFRLHAEAFDDIDSIRKYVATDNPNAADRLVTEFFQAIRSLVSFPHQAFRRADFGTDDLRFKLVREYVIAYAPDPRPLWILGVFHGRRSPRVIAAMLRSRFQ